MPWAALAQEEWAQPAQTTRGAALDTSVVQDRRFDMRDDPAMYVSDVRLQMPWNTRWAFGATAAAESSIFADTGKRVDLSERHLVWFAHTPIAAVDDPTQAGEGIYPVSPSTGPNGKLTGDNMSDVSTTYSSGAGPVLESAWPYNGRDGLTDLEVIRLAPDRWKEGQYQDRFGGMTEADIADALSAAGLAGALKAPVVLTAPGALSPEAAAKIGRLSVRRALLMGGEAALSPTVADAVAALAAHRDAVGSVHVVGGEAAVGRAAFEAARDALG